MEPAIDQPILMDSPLSAAWRYKWVVLSMAVLGGLIAATLVSALNTSRFVARASLVVSDPRASTLFGAADAGQSDARRYVADQVAILVSDAVALRASELAHEEEPRFLEWFDAVDTPFGYDVVSDPGSDEIVILYTAEDPSSAVAAANAVVEAYTEVRRSEALRNSASAIQQLDESIANIELELSAIQDQIDSARNDPTRQELEQQFGTALDRLGELQPRLADASEDAAPALRAEIQDLQDQFAALAAIIGIEEQDPQLVQLYREQSEAVTRRSTLAEERDRLLVDTQLLSGGVTLSSPARFARPVPLQIVAKSALGVLFGLVVGVGIAYLTANRRRRFTDAADPGRVLGAPILAEVPSFHDELIPGPLPALNNPQSASAEAFRFAAASLDLLVSPDRRTAEGARAVAPSTFLVTSATLAEGKTTTVANVAVAAARKGRRVLVIDADFGSQSLSEILRGKATSGPGITEVVEAGLRLGDALHSVGPPGTLDVLSRGARPTTAPDFFSLPATRALISQIGTDYDLVLIDGPPMLLVAYASTIAQYVDRVVPIVPHNGSVSRIEELARRLALIGTPVAGYVYNWAPLRPEMTLSEGSLRDVIAEKPTDKQRFPLHRP